MILVVALVFTGFFVSSPVETSATEDGGDGVGLAAEVADGNGDIEAESVFTLAEPAIGSTRDDYKIPYYHPYELPDYVTQVPVTLIATSEHFLIYAESGLSGEFADYFPGEESGATGSSMGISNTLEEVASFMLDPNLPTYMGAPYDRDSNGKTTLIFADLNYGVNHVPGYFTKTDFGDTCNRADILYIDKGSLSGSLNANVVVRCLQQLINYSYKGGNEGASQPWFDEGLSYFASELWDNYSANMGAGNPVSDKTASDSFYSDEYGATGDAFSYLPVGTATGDLVNELGRIQAQHYWRYKGEEAEQPLFRLVSDPRGGDDTKTVLGDNWLLNQGKNVSEDGYDQFFDNWVLSMAVDSGDLLSAQNSSYTWTTRKSLGSVSASAIGAEESVNLQGGKTYRPDLKLFSKKDATFDFKITDNSGTSNYKNKFYLIYPKTDAKNVTSYDSWASAERTYKEIKAGQEYSFNDGGKGTYFAILAIGHDKDVNATFQTLKPFHKIQTKTNISKVHGNASFKLGATSSTGAKFTYKSSNTKVATISTAGKVTIKGPGKAKITVTAKETTKYRKATATTVIKVKPKKVTSKTLKSAATKSVTLTWTAVSANSGYQILLATNSGFSKNKKTVAVAGGSAKSKKVKGLKKGKTYYVKVRAYKTIDGKKVYGAYSVARHVKTK
jgi:hypothetical protein